MNDQYFWLCLFLLAGFCGAFDRRRVADWILLSETRFWSIVAREEHSLVVLTTRGFLRKRRCYLYPHQGVIFYTWNRPEMLPEGVTLVPTLEELA